MNVNILGISELKWTGMGEFNSDNHYTYYCGQESLRRNEVACLHHLNKGFYVWKKPMDASIALIAAAAAKSLQSCPTLCDPIDGSPPGSPVPGILQARTLEWVAISFSNA